MKIKIVQLFIVIFDKFFSVIIKFSRSNYVIHKILQILNKHLGFGYAGPDTVINEVSILKSFFKNKEELILIDVGASTGDYTKQLNRLFKNSDIYSFEPSKDSFEVLKNNFKEYEKVKCINKGLENFTGQTKIYADKSGSRLSSLTRRKLDYLNISFDHSEMVEIITFDDFWKENLNKKIVDLLKLDVEGHELNVLKGSINAIEFIRVIQFEFGGCNLDTRTFFKDFWYFFDKFNFEIFRLTPHGLKKVEKYSENLEHFITTNYFAINKSL